MITDKVKLLITGGAGFIGSNLVEKYINDERIELIRVIDNFSTGYFNNIKSFFSNPKFEFIEGDICNYETCLSITKDIDKVTHQAALGSVPRSIKNPMKTTEVNILGTVNLMHACHINKVDRIILACSSSTYGDSKELPKVESQIGKPLSPYAVTKYVTEVFADTFNRNYGLNYIGLRYFNVFGPRQDPNGAYAAVIPTFCKAFLESKPVVINGDGETTRDFTYVSNVILANDLALFSKNPLAMNQVYNVACGEQISLNQVIKCLKNISKLNVQLTYQAERDGDVRHSKADINKIIELLGYKPETNFYEGLEKVFEWYIKDNTHTQLSK
ncbi:SDR family oxidoreductase [Asinibacterium sp. OR53]|uniref:SDR family oxidoreductase n=1 Tax=Asinibacterium sp. OR53 TaxID=925409 RepID=UPI00047E3637|nr:SDR family oxidoreductase [Asinibacterium sp. OR53]